LFCGKEREGVVFDYSRHYECGCPDAKKQRYLEEKIDKIRRQMPIEKYRIEQRNVLMDK